MSTANNNEAKYNLVFERQIKDGADLVIVKEKLKKFFKNKPDVVEKLFLKEKTILKRNLSKTEVAKYKLIFETTGAKCSINKIIDTDKKHAPIKTSKTEQVNKTQAINNVATHGVEQSTKAVNSQDKSSGLTKKIIWALLILIVLSIISWGSLYIINSDHSISATDDNEQDLTKPDVEPSINYLLF